MTHGTDEIIFKLYTSLVIFSIYPSFFCRIPLWASMDDHSPMKIIDPSAVPASMQTRMACKYIWGEVKELNGSLPKASFGWLDAANHWVESI